MGHGHGTKQRKTWLGNIIYQALRHHPNLDTLDVQRVDYRTVLVRMKNEDSTKMDFTIQVKGMY
jgi:hypothetical protein